MIIIKFKQIAELLLFIFILLTFSSALAQSFDSRVGDEQALEDFYVAMDGPNWDSNTGWDDNNMDLSQNIFGVEVARIDGELRVVKMNLSGGSTQTNNSNIIGNGLRGNSIPDSFGNLKQLRELRLKGNDITARVDNWVQDLTNIVTLSLSASTSYGGQQEIDLDDRSFYPHPSKNNYSANKFSGPLPDDLSMLSSLELLEIANSNLTGSLPTKLPSSIRGLFLTNNKMEGTLLAWENCVNMTHLFLGTRYDGEGWTGTIPPEWDNMDIVWLSLETNSSGNSLTGGIPEFRGWTDVRYFETTGQRNLDSAFPDWLFDTDGKNDLLHTFDVGGAIAAGETIPDQADVPTHLKVLSMTSNDMKGRVPSWVSEPGIIQYNLRDNNFSGTLPSINGRNIRWVQVENNEFTGSLPELKNPGSSSNFTHMRFNNNKFNGDIPASYGDITADNFSELNLRDNLLDGNIPAGIFGHGWAIRLENNKYTPQNLVPILGQNLSAVTYLPQKPFGPADQVYSVGQTIDRSSFEYSGNSYRWYRNGSPISGETSPTIDTGTYGEGTYVLEITHPDIDYTFESEPVKVN